MDQEGFGSPLGFSFLQFKSLILLSGCRIYILDFCKRKDGSAKMASLVCHIYWYVWEGRNKFVLEVTPPNPELCCIKPLSFMGST